MLENIRRWVAAHPCWTLALATLAVLFPFLGKPFNMDDPLFLWAARRIQSHPADPYGFNVIWDLWAKPLWNVTENPPLTSYYIALAAAVLGWSEWALHSAFLLPAVAVILGTFRLARHFCRSPLLAALAALFTPAFLVSSTTLMSDVPMLAFWVWAIVFWVEGAGQNRPRKLFAAACLAAIAEITKYFGFCLIPLLAAYSIMAKKPLRQWLQFLLVPLAVFCAYQMVMEKLYGISPLSRAANFRYSNENYHFPYDACCLMGLAFTGGCLATAFFFAPLLWRKGSAALFLAVAVLPVAAVCLDSGWLQAFNGLEGGHVHVATQIQLAFWAAAGVSALLLAVADFASCRDAKSLLLALWIIGTFIFAAFLNWTINGRSILPMAPALGILIARRLERNFRGAPFPARRAAVCLAASAALALYVTEADCLTAFAARQNVRAISAAFGPKIKNLWFQGHWGFQFYLSRLGARPVDFANSRLKPGDLLAIPSNNSNTIPPDKAVRLAVFLQPGPPGVATVNETLGASFYASGLGPLPFVFGPIPSEGVFIYSWR